MLDIHAKLATSVWKARTLYSERLDFLNSKWLAEFRLEFVKFLK